MRSNRRGHSSHLTDGIFACEDGLGRRSMARQIAAYAIASSPSNDNEEMDNACRIIGVFGGWGSGKTHLLRLVGHEIITNQRCDRHLIALFPAWRFELEGDLGRALLHALSYLSSYPQLAKLQDEALKWSLGTRLKEKASKFFELLGDVSGLAKEIDPIAGAATKSLAAAGSHHIATREKSQQDKPNVELLSKAFADLVDAALGKDYDRLIILVDDLDRCAPPSMVRMLEWMKVHLRSDKCTFVVGLDHRAAARAIEGQYSSYIRKDSDISFGYRYLDKLFEMDFELGHCRSLQAMVVKKCFARYADNRVKLEDFSDATYAVCKTNFPWGEWLRELPNLRCLNVARSLLRIGTAYEIVLRQWADSTNQERLHFPREAPFWILFLLGMQHTLRPRDLDALANHRGEIYQAIATPKDSSSILIALPPEHPKRQLADFLIGKHNQYKTLTIPTIPQFKAMVDLVRQKTHDALLEAF